MTNNKYHDIASEILEIVGPDNIVSAIHCATRLRLIVKDKDKIDTKAIEKVDEVKGTFFNSGQYQIILGTGIVNKVFEELEAMNVSTIDKSQQDEYVKSQEKGIKALMRTLGDIVVPIVHWLETILIAVTQAVMNIPFGIGGFIGLFNINLSNFIVGGTGSDSLNLEMPEKAPFKYESSSQNIIAIAGLKAALEELNIEENYTKEKEVDTHLQQL